MTNQMTDGLEFNAQGLHDRYIGYSAAVGSQERHALNSGQTGFKLIAKVGGITRFTFFTSFPNKSLIRVSQSNR
jgi:hypothetical protein